MSVSDGASTNKAFNIFEHLRLDNSDRAAFVDLEGNSLSYSELLGKAIEIKDRIADLALDSLGRSVLVLPDHPTTAILQLALMGDNCSLVLANPSNNKRELTELIDSVGANSIISESDNSLVTQLAREASLLHLGISISGTDNFELSIQKICQPESRAKSASHDNSIALILPTSGSTGTPKLVPLPLTAILKSAANISEHLSLGKEDRALHILPMFHIGAIVDLVLAPLIGRGSVYFAHGLAFDQLASGVRNQRASWMQLVPTMLTRLVVETSDEELLLLGDSLRFVRSVSSDLAPKEQSEAEAVLGATPIIQIYGMTETCGQIASNPLPPEERKQGSVGRAAGAEISILDAFGNPLEVSEEGEICVRGETVISGYENLDNSQVFFGPWLRTGDLGKFDTEGYLYISGRLKEIVNRGGEKIALQEIDRVALSHPDVQEAAAFSVSHPSLGEEVAIALTLNGDSNEPDFKSYFAENLAQHKCPRQVLVLDQLPRLGSGKIDRRSLAERVEVDQDSVANLSSGDYQAQSLNEQLVSRLWSKILRTQAPVPGDDFFDAGGDSLAATGFLAALEKATRKNFPADLLYKAPVYEKLVQAIDEIGMSSDHRLDLPKPIFDAVRHATAAWPGRRRRKDSLIIELNTVGSRQSFFWCGNGRDNFEDIVEEFGADRPLYVLRTLSGLKQKTTANTELLARHYALEIEQIEPIGPICIGGVCQGAVLAKRIVEQLADRGREIKLVVFVDRIFVESFEFPTLLIWSGSSQYSARIAYAKPELGLPWLYPRGAKALHHSKSHDALVTGEGAEELVLNIASYLDGVKEIASPSQQSSEVLEERKQLYGAIVAGRLPRLVRAGEILKVKVRITNISEGDWNADNGFSIAARWFNLDGHIRIVRAGGAELGQALRREETTDLEFEIEVPGKRLPYILLIDMVDEGVGWFHQMGSKRIKSQFVIVY
jgi:oxalate---CoA ligase